MTMPERPLRQGLIVLGYTLLGAISGLVLPAANEGRTELDFSLLEDYADSMLFLAVIGAFVGAVLSSHGRIR